MERLRNSPESKGRLLAEALWQKIRDDEKARPLLQRLDPRITLLGNGKNFNLLWEIWKTNHKAKVAIASEGLQPEQIDQLNLPPEIKVEIFQEDISFLDQVLPPQDLVITQGIHRFDAPKLVRATFEILQERGVFFATASGRGRKTSSELENTGIHFTKKTLRTHPLRLGPKEVLFIFSKEVPIPAPQKSKRSFRAPYAV